MKTSFEPCCFFSGNPSLTVTAVLLISILMVGCELEEPTVDESSIAETHFPVHNGVDIINDYSSGCTVSRMNKLNNAYYLLRDTVTDLRYRQCLQDAFFTQTQEYSDPTDNVDPDSIWDYSNTFLQIEIHCVADGVCQGGVACTLEGNPETLQVEYDTVDWCDESCLAGVYMHEIMHDYEFFHSLADGSSVYSQTVNNVVNQCVVNVATNQSDIMNGLLIGRSELIGQIELNHMGADDQSPTFDYRCPTGKAVASFSAYITQDFNPTVTKLTFKCYTMDLVSNSWSSGTASTYNISGNTQNSISKPLVSCGTNEVVVAVNGRSGFYIDRVEMQCAPIANVEAGNNEPTRTIPNPSSEGSGYGGGSGHDFARDCPDGSVLTGFRGRVDGSLPVGQLKPLCSPITDLTKRSHTVYSLVGSAVGIPYDLRCSGTSAMIGMFGRYGAYGGIQCVHRVGVACKNFVAGNNNQLNNSQSYHISDGAGFWGSGPGTSTSFGVDECPADFVLAGLTVRYGSLIDNIEGVCVRLSAWRNWNGPPDPWDWQNDEFHLTARGGSGGSSTTLWCPYKKVMTGLYPYAKFGDSITDGVVYGLKIICES